MEYFAIVIASLSLIITVLVYFKHDREIKEQEVKLNEYQLGKHRTEQELAKKALISISCEKKLNEKNLYDYFIKVENIGKSTARNLLIEIPKLNGIYEGTDQQEIDLRPGKEYLINIGFSINAPPVFLIKISWDDEFQNNNVDEQKIFIP
jgi:hypothetical protein